MNMWMENFSNFLIKWTLWKLDVNRLQNEEFLSSNGCDSLWPILGRRQRYKTKKGRRPLCHSSSLSHSPMEPSFCANCTANILLLKDVNDLVWAAGTGTNIYLQVIINLQNSVRIKWDENTWRVSRVWLTLLQPKESWYCWQSMGRVGIKVSILKIVLCACTGMNPWTFPLDAMIGMSTAILCMTRIGPRVGILIQVKTILKNKTQQNKKMTNQLTNQEIKTNYESYRRWPRLQNH